MGKSIVNNVVPKKGKLRSAQKRPAAKKSTTWKGVKYVRENCAVGPRGQRKDQIKWKRTLHQLLRASDKEILNILIADKTLHQLLRASDKEILNILIADKFIPKSEGKTCPTCSKGTLSKLQLDRHGEEDLEKKEKEIVFGDGKSWKDIEADEATFDRRLYRVLHLEFVNIQSKDCVMMWEQWAGIIQRGRPETLVLCRLQPKITVKRAPGPGAIRKIEWKANPSLDNVLAFH
eukprot:s725_g3.t1